MLVTHKFQLNQKNDLFNSVGKAINFDSAFESHSSIKPTREYFKRAAEFEKMNTVEYFKDKFMMFKLTKIFKVKYFAFIRYLLTRKYCLKKTLSTYVLTHNKAII